MFRKILTATRNPAEFDTVVLSAARIAEFNRALLTIVHVVEPLNGVERNVVRHFKTGKKIILDASGSYLQEVREALYKNYASILSPLEKYKVSVQCGFAWMEILKSSRQNDVDLIAMGSHTKIKGKLQESRWYVGSAVERVSAESVCPVVVITDPEVLEKWEG